MEEDKDECGSYKVIEKKVKWVLAFILRVKMLIGYVIIIYASS